MRCLSYCFADKLDLSVIEAYLRLQPHCRMVRHRKVLEVAHETRGLRYYIFSNGTLVGWGCHKEELLAYIHFIARGAPHEIYPTAQFLSHHFSYQLAKKTVIFPHEYFSVDCFSLEDDDPELKLALSFGFSQSIKLAYYEQKVDRLINEYIPYTADLSRTGMVRLRAQELQAIVGRVLSVKSEINLMSDFLYLPKFFWQHPNLEEYFVMSQKYLDISERTEKLNQQLNTLNELFVMYSSYLESKHSYIIELTIVILIAIELVFSLLNFLHIPS